jgi:hypothetical protein
MPGTLLTPYCFLGQSFSCECFGFIRANWRLFSEESKPEILSREVGCGT